MSFFGISNPFAADPQSVKDAKAALAAAQTTAKDTPSLANDLAVIDAECNITKEKRKAKETADVGASTNGMAQVSRGGRRKRKGGKHTKKHRKGGKSKRARTGRKSSHL